MFKAEWNFEMTDDLYYFFHVVHYIFFLHETGVMVGIKSKILPSH